MCKRSKYESFKEYSCKVSILYLVGTRFRPLSLELPKPLFPVAGYPVIYHHIEACSKVWTPNILCTSQIAQKTSYNQWTFSQKLS